MTMITPSYLGETIEYSSLHACRSTLEDPTPESGDPQKRLCVSTVSALPAPSTASSSGSSSSPSSSGSASASSSAGAASAGHANNAAKNDEDVGRHGAEDGEGEDAEEDAEDDAEDEDGDDGEGEEEDDDGEDEDDAEHDDAEEKAADVQDADDDEDYVPSYGGRYADSGVEKKKKNMSAEEIFQHIRFSAVEGVPVVAALDVLEHITGRRQCGSNLWNGPHVKRHISGVISRLNLPCTRGGVKFSGGPPSPVLTHAQLLQLVGRMQQRAFFTACVTKAKASSWFLKVLEALKSGPGSAASASASASAANANASASASASGGDAGSGAIDNNKNHAHGPNHQSKEEKDKGTTNAHLKDIRFDVVGNTPVVSILDVLARIAGNRSSGKHVWNVRGAKKVVSGPVARIQLPTVRRCDGVVYLMGPSSPMLTASQLSELLQHVQNRGYFASRLPRAMETWLPQVMAKLASSSSSASSSSASSSGGASAKQDAGEEDADEQDAGEEDEEDAGDASAGDAKTAAEMLKTIRFGVDAENTPVVSALDVLACITGRREFGSDLWNGPYIKHHISGAISRLNLPYTRAGVTLSGGPPTPVLTASQLSELLQHVQHRGYFASRLQRAMKNWVPQVMAKLASASSSSSSSSALASSSASSSASHEASAEKEEEEEEDAGDASADEEDADKEEEDASEPVSKTPDGILKTIRFGVIDNMPVVSVLDLLAHVTGRRLTGKTLWNNTGAKNFVSGVVARLKLPSFRDGMTSKYRGPANPMLTASQLVELLQRMQSRGLFVAGVKNAMMSWLPRVMTKLNASIGSSEASSASAAFSAFSASVLSLLPALPALPVLPVLPVVLPHRLCRLRLAQERR